MEALQNKILVSLLLFVFFECLSIDSAAIFVGYGY